MKKMPCLFVREFHGDRTFTITEQVTPGCEWVLAGEGVATRKWDGTAVLVKDGLLYARYDAKKGKTPPAGAIPCTEAPDPITGHWPHWMLADGPQHKWIREAFANRQRAYGSVLSGTYEAIGPSINGNADGHHERWLMPHGDARVPTGIRAYLNSFTLIREFLAAKRRHVYADPSAMESVPEYWEGIVFHHPDGRMCKIRRDDFGLPWPVKEEP